MRNTVFALTVCGALFLGEAQAAPDVAGVAGFGTESCAAVTKALTTTPALMEQTYLPWAQGYMSGVNGVFIANGRPYREIARDPEGERKFIANYCTKYPKSKFLDAVIALYQSRPIAQ